MPSQIHINSYLNELLRSLTELMPTLHLDKLCPVLIDLKQHRELDLNRSLAENGISASARLLLC